MNCDRCYKNIGASYEGNNLDPLVIFYQALQGINAEDEHYCKQCVAEMRCLAQAVTPRPFQVQDILEVSIISDWSVRDIKDNELLNKQMVLTQNLTIKELLKILHREVVTIHAKKDKLIITSKGGK